MADDELFINDLPETLRGVAQRHPKLITTMALGEEGDHPTTMALGEEGGETAAPFAAQQQRGRPTRVLGQGWVVTTMAVGEEGGDPTTMALGEEGGELAAVPAVMHGTVVTTLRVGEEGDDATTMAVGEEGGDYQ